MSNIAKEIQYKVGKQKQQWPNHNDKKLSDTARVLRQVFPDRIEIEGSIDSNDKDPNTVGISSLYLDLGPATRQLVAVTKQRET